MKHSRFFIFCLMLLGGVVSVIPFSLQANNNCHHLVGWKIIQKINSKEYLISEFDQQAILITEDKNKYQSIGNTIMIFVSQEGLRSIKLANGFDKKIDVFKEKSSCEKTINEEIDARMSPEQKMESALVKIYQLSLHETHQWSKSDLDTAESVLKQGISPNSKGKFVPVSPFMRSARQADPSGLKLFMKYGANVKGLGLEAVCEAAGSGRIESIKALSDAGAPRKGDCSPYFSAIEDSMGKVHADIVKFLIEQGYDVNSMRTVELDEGPGKQSPLDFAIYRLNYESTKTSSTTKSDLEVIIELLKKNGAKGKLKTKDQRKKEKKEFENLYE